MPIERNKDNHVIRTKCANKIMISVIVVSVMIVLVATIIIFSSPPLSCSNKQ